MYFITSIAINQRLNKYKCIKKINRRQANLFYGAKSIGSTNTNQISGYVRVSSPVVFARAWYKKIPFKHVALFTERAHCELWVNYELGKWQNFFGSCLEFCFWHTCVGNLLELINVAPSLLVYETILDKLAAEYYSPEIWHPEYMKFIIKILNVILKGIHLLKVSINTGARY